MEPREVQMEPMVLKGLPRSQRVPPWSQRVHLLTKDLCCPSCPIHTYPWCPIVPQVPLWSQGTPIAPLWPPSPY